MLKAHTKIKSLLEPLQCQTHSKALKEGDTAGVKFICTVCFCTESYVLRMSNTAGCTQFGSDLLIDTVHMDARSDAYMSKPTSRIAGVDLAPGNMFSQHPILLFAFSTTRQ